MTRRSDRGFVMILVLMLVAIVLAIFVGQLGIVQSQKVVAFRDNDQLQARAIADRCLARARIYIDQIRAERNPLDWDFVLDPGLDSHPNGNGGQDKFDEDFVPNATFGGSVVYVPSSEAAQTGLRQALHRWRLVPMDGGACLVRFDDNTDDFKTTGTGGQDNATTKFENNGKDVVFRDRDMGIFISAMGIFPVASATPADEAYDRARARVTTKTFIGTGGAPGIVAKTNVTLENTIAVCGLGGLQANKLDYTAGGNPTGVCTCGDTATTDPSSAGHPGDCVSTVSPGTLCDPALACQPGAKTTNAQPPNPNVRVPMPVDWLELSGFQDPGNPVSLGDNGVCEFYYRSHNVDFTWRGDPTTDTVTNPLANDLNATGAVMDGSEPGEIFVWDHTDDDAQGCRDDLSVLACPTGKRITHSCRSIGDTTYTVGGKPVVKRPCRWKSVGANGRNVICTDEQTPCWKLVAGITTAGAPSANVAQNFLDTPVTMTEHTRDGSFSETFEPKAGPPPNIEGAFGDPVGGPDHDGDAGNASFTWDTLCGPCPQCIGIEGWGLRSDEHFHFEKAPMCRENFFDRSILVFENQVRDLGFASDDGRFHVRENWGSTSCASGPVRHTIIAQSHIEVEFNTRICGVFSNCDIKPTCSADQISKAVGFVMRGGGSCFVGAGATYIGDVQCGNIHINNNSTPACSVGDLVAFNDAAATPMGSVCPSTTVTAGFAPCSKGICMNANWTMVGDIIGDGDVCIRSGATVFGSVLAGGDGSGNVFIENNTTIHGQLVSEGSIGMKSNVVINNNGTGIFGSRVTSGIRIETSY